MTTDTGKITKKAALAFLREKLGTCEAWAVRGLILIYTYQTAQEKAEGKTRDDNGVGFSGVDAQFLTSLAEGFKRTGRITPRQLPYLLRKMPKYAAQILNHTDPDKLRKAMDKTAVQLELATT